jgi:hypothetical protein
LVSFFSCEEGTSSTTTTSGAGGAGGCPLSQPEALFTVIVSARGEALPNDTTLSVRWSAGAEPTFILGDRDTWHTLDDGSNVVCDIDHDAGVPSDLEELRCELWTSGATEIEVGASGFVTYLETVTPEEREGCDHPIPSEVTVELVPDLDAGRR